MLKQVPSRNLVRTTLVHSKSVSKSIINTMCLRVALQCIQHDQRWLSDAHGDALREPDRVQTEYHLIRCSMENGSECSVLALLYRNASLGLRLCAPPEAQD